MENSDIVRTNPDADETHLTMESNLVLFPRVTSHIF